MATLSYLSFWSPTSPVSLKGKHFLRRRLVSGEGLHGEKEFEWGHHSQHSNIVFFSYSNFLRGERRRRRFWEELVVFGEGEIGFFVEERQIIKWGICGRRIFSSMLRRGRLVGEDTIESLEKRIVLQPHIPTLVGSPSITTFVLL